MRAPGDACGAGLPTGDTAQFVGLAGPGRRVAKLQLWSPAPNHLSYLEAWRSDSVSYRWSGDIDVGGDGTPRQFTAMRWENGVVRNTETVRRVGDSAVVERDGRRTATRLGAGDVPIPALRPSPVYAVLAQCALHRSDRQLLTDRFGSLRVRRAGAITLWKSGRREAVTLFAVSADSNSDITRLWLDARGRFFATSDADGLSDMLLPFDQPSDMDELMSAEVLASEPRMRETARLLGETHAGGIAFVHARIIDVERGQALEKMSVLVRGARISAIVPDSAFTAPSSVTIVDVSGKTLVPGLWDVGQHRTNGPSWAMTDANTRRLLSRGVTSIQEMEGDTIYTPLLARRIETGQQVGPRIFPACTMDGWYPDSVRGAVPQRLGRHGQVRDSSEVRRLVRRCASLGVRLFMLNDNLPRDLTLLAIAEAHAAGIRVTGDALRGRSTRDLLVAGFDEFAHVFQAVSPFVDAAGDSAAWLLHRHGGISSFWNSKSVFPQLDLAAAPIQEMVAQLAKRHVVLQTTLCVYPPVNRNPGHDTTWDRASFAKLQEFTLLVHRAGVPLLPSTDSACPITREMELLHDIGFENADLIVCDGDPLARIGDLAQLSMDVKNGVLYRDLQALRADLPFLGRGTP